MKKPSHLYKTTIVIYSEFNPEDMWEIDELAKEAMNGSAYCDSCFSKKITNPDEFPKTEFFDKYIENEDD